MSSGHCDMQQQATFTDVFPSALDMLVSSLSWVLRHVQLLVGFSVDCPVYQALVANVTETLQYKSIRERYRVCV